MDERQLGSDTAPCPTCGAALEVVVNVGGSTSPVTCLICYGDPESAPEPAAPVEPAVEPEAPQTAADDALPREVGTDVTAPEG